MGGELVVPAQLTGIGIQRHDRIGIEIITGSQIAVIVRVWIAYSPIDQIQFGVIAAIHPGAAPAPRQHLRVVWPGLTARLTRPWNGIETPESIARSRVIGIDKAPGCVLATGDADDDFIIEYQRRQGGGVALAVICQHHVPEYVAAAAVERQQMCIQRHHEQAVSQHAETTIDRCAGAIGQV